MNILREYLIEFGFSSNLMAKAKSGVSGIFGKHSQTTPPSQRRNYASAMVRKPRAKSYDLGEASKQNDDDDDDSIITSTAKNINKNLNVVNSRKYKNIIKAAGLGLSGLGVGLSAANLANNMRLKNRNIPTKIKARVKKLMK